MILNFTTFTKPHAKTLKNTKAKIFFKSHKIGAYLKKPHIFGRSNTQAGVNLFVSQSNKHF
ncbi:hypothetical protein FIM45_05490 [Helicobacter pylori]|nr:hypothetical protein FIM45_05490 [Helicobacter pylori]